MDEDTDKKAEAIVSTFARKLRDLANCGDIPDHWKKCVLAAIRNKPGRKADKATAIRDFAIAKEMRRRRAAHESPTKVAEEISQRLYDSTPGSGAPLEVSRIFDIEREQKFDILAEEIIEDWLAEDKTNSANEGLK